MRIKTIFIGSGEFAVPILDKLLQSDLIEITCVISQPDKPVGRKQILTPTPVSEFLQKNSIKISLETPVKIRLEADNLLNKYQPELIIVASYGQIIPESILNYPKYKALNIHGSLLPELRGAVPVQMSILNGLSKTGVTIQRMVYQMDAGPIVGLKEIELNNKETSDLLMDKLGNLGAELLIQILPKWIDGQIQEVPQNEMGATYCYKDDIAKNKAEITFETDIDLAERMVRAFYPWPIAWVKYNNKFIKIYSAIVSTPIPGLENLRFIKKDKKLYLGLKNGSLEILELQEEGKKRGEFKNYFYLADIKS